MMLLISQNCQGNWQCEGRFLLWDSVREVFFSGTVWDSHSFSRCPFLQTSFARVWKNGVETGPACSREHLFSMLGVTDSLTLWNQSAQEAVCRNDRQTSPSLGGGGDVGRRLAALRTLLPRAIASYRGTGLPSDHWLSQGSAEVLMRAHLEGNNKRVLDRDVLKVNAVVWSEVFVLFSRVDHILLQFMTFLWAQD